MRNDKRFSGWFDNSEKEMCLGVVFACRVDPVVALHLRNAADYRLPTFGPHGTNLWHSGFQWKMKT